MTSHQKQRVALYKLSDRLKGAGADTFTQRQLDAAMMALGDVNGALLPPARVGQRSYWVLMELRGFSDFFFGWYDHGTSEWQIIGMGGDAPDVIEWWPLPGGAS